MKLLQGKRWLIIFAALTIGISVILLAGFGFARDWRDRDLWNRPERPSEQTNNIPSDRPDEASATGENQIKDHSRSEKAINYPQKSGKAAQVPLPSQQPSSPLTPNLDEDFKKPGK